MSKAWFTLLLFLAGCSTGGGYSFGELDTAPFVKARADVSSHFYIWASFEAPNVYSRNGQNLSQADIYGAGIGAVQKPFLFEFGKYRADLSPNKQIELEATSYHLRHNFGTPPFPVTNARYSLRGDWGGKLGMFKERGKLRFEVNYRFLRLREKIEIWDSEQTVECNCWWLELHTRKADALEAGVYYNF